MIVSTDTYGSVLFPFQVRVDVHFCGLNFADILVCRGQYQERPHLPFTPGEYEGLSDSCRRRRHNLQNHVLHLRLYPGGACPLSGASQPRPSHRSWETLGCEPLGGNAYDCLTLLLSPRLAL